MTDTFARAARDTQLPTLSAVGHASFGALLGVSLTDTSATPQIGGYLSLREREVSIRSSFLHVGEASHVGLSVASGRLSLSQRVIDVVSVSVDGAFCALGALAHVAVGAAFGEFTFNLSAGYASAHHSAVFGATFADGPIGVSASVTTGDAPAAQVTLRIAS